jgi:hypothetical protein
MYPKSLNGLRELNKGLKANEWNSFRKLVLQLCQDHPNVPCTSRISGLIRNSDVTGLLDLADSLVAQSYATAAEHFAANQFASLLRKYPYPKDLLKLDPRENAVKKFWKTEHKCSRVNQRFVCYHKRSPYESQLSAMRNFCTYVLGHSPDMARIYDECAFGPGANVGTHGNATNAARKLTGSWSVSPAALYLGAAAMKRHQQLFEYVCSDGSQSDLFYSHCPDLFNRNYARRISLCTYNKISFVAKTATTHRSIAVEPLVNSWIQKGVDSSMRARLLRVGIDLSNQEKNCEMARQGSLDATDDSFVTLDLASASDSIAIGLVRNLLPPDWFDLLNSIRSKNFLLDGVEYTYSKFCSMGNGFCFPLETLIFTAACHAVGAGRPGHDFHVYGDDIIVRKRYATELIALFKVLGFSLNMEKSFIEGPFRESCGRDWFAGNDVRPFVLNFSLGSLPCVFKFLNLTQRNERSSMFFRESRYLVTSMIPDRWQLRRPSTLSNSRVKRGADTAIDSTLDEFMSSPFAQWSRDLQCWSWRELSVTPIEDFDWKKQKRRDLLLTFGAYQGADVRAPFTFRRMTKTRVRRVTHSVPVDELTG